MSVDNRTTSRATNRMIEVRVRFWTDNIVPGKGKIKPQARVDKRGRGYGA